MSECAISELLYMLIELTEKYNRLQNNSKI